MNKCQPCGGSLQPACTHPASPCNPPLTENDDGICISTPCGLQAEACCPGNQCKEDWTTCVGNTCISCGALGRPACQGMSLYTHVDHVSFSECLWLFLCAVATAVAAACIVHEKNACRTPMLQYIMIGLGMCQVSPVDVRKFHDPV
jgi:hypothetical protein